MDTPKPAEYRLTAEDADFLAAAIMTGAEAGRLTCVYCRHSLTGELHPILAVLVRDPGGSGEDRVMAIAQIFAPNAPRDFEAPTPEDNPGPAEDFHEDDQSPKILMPSEHRQ